MKTLKYYFCLCLIVAPVIRAQGINNKAPGIPKVTVSQRTISIPKGGSGSIECIPEGDPLPAVEWVKANGDGVRRSGNTLIISEAREEDQGHYVCNGLVDGTVMSSDYLSVGIGVPPARGNPKVTVSQRTVSIPKGGNGSIECIPEGDPLPTVEWIKSDGEFGNRVRQSGNKLIISDAQEEDRGHYTCQGIVDGSVKVTDHARVDIEAAVPPATGNPKVTVSQGPANIATGGSGSIECTPEFDGEFRNGVNHTVNIDSRVDIEVRVSTTTETSNDKGSGPPNIDDDTVGDDHDHVHDHSDKSETTEKNTADEEPIISTTTYVCVSSIIFFFIFAILVYFYYKHSKCLLRDRYYSRFYGKTWGDADSCVVMIRPTD